MTFCPKFVHSIQQFQALSQQRARMSSQLSSSRIAKVQETYLLRWCLEALYKDWLLCNELLLPKIANRYQGPQMYFSADSFFSPSHIKTCWNSSFYLSSSKVQSAAPRSSFSKSSHWSTTFAREGWSSVDKQHGQDFHLYLYFLLKELLIGSYFNSFWCSQRDEN